MYIRKHEGAQSQELIQMNYLYPIGQDQATQSTELGQKTMDASQATILFAPLMHDFGGVNEKDGYFGQGQQDAFNPAGLQQSGTHNDIQRIAGWVTPLLLLRSHYRCHYLFRP